MQHNMQGFSLFELLVALAIFALGMLGNASLQAQATTYIAQARYQNAAHLLALDLQSIYQQLLAQPKQTNDLAAKQLASAYRLSSCNPALITLENQLNCWTERAFEQLPESQQLFADYFLICLSRQAGQCDSQGDALEVQLAWRGRQDLCIQPAANDSVCLYRMRLEL